MTITQALSQSSTQASAQANALHSRLRDALTVVEQVSGYGDAHRRADYFVHARFLRESAAHLGLDCRQVAAGAPAISSVRI